MRFLTFSGVLIAMRKIFLIVLICSFGIAALLGMSVVVMDFRYPMSESLLMTGLILALVSTGCFVCSLATEKRKTAWLGYLGIGIDLLTVLALGVGVWFHRIIPEVLNSNGVVFCFVILSSLGCALPIFALLAWFNLKPIARFTRGLAFVFLIGGLLTLWPAAGVEIFAGYPDYRDFSELFFKLFACFTILAVLGTIATLILAKFYSIKPTEMTEDTPSLHLTCPRCLTQQDVLVGESACCHCRLKFKIEIEEPRCSQCGYLLRGLTRPICPECGAIFSESEQISTIAAYSAPASSPPIPE